MSSSAEFWSAKVSKSSASESSAWWPTSSTQARLTVASQEWQVRAGQVYLVRRGQLSGRTYWLIQARNVATGEVKYFVSNAPADTPLATHFCP